VGTVDTLSKIFTEGTKADSLPQHKIFCSLETHVEYLDNIREAIDLHDRMMVRTTPFWRHLYTKSDQFTKPGSGQTWKKLRKRWVLSQVAFNIANWSGPNGANLSNTIERAYQQAIHEYNNTGAEMLIEMSRFPTEIEEVRKTPV